MRGLLMAAVLLAPGWAGAQTLPTVRMGWCARTLNSAVAPVAVAQKMGWYQQAGFRVEAVPMNGSIDCTKNVATGEVPYAIASIEPVATIAAQGVHVVNYYTAYQGNIYGIAVPEDSPVRSIADLRGKRIGVTSMASAGVILARALVSNAGMNPDRDVRIVVAGEGAQTAAMLRGNQVDALSQYDTTYALAQNAGAKLRFLPENKAIAAFPSNGIIAMDETLKSRRAEAVAFARAYAMGTVFTIANPEAAVRILWEVYPQTKATGKDEATALADDVRTIQARVPSWKLDAGGVSKWGESSMANYEAYLDFLLKWGVIKEKVAVSQIVTNALVDDINTFDPAAVEAQARAWKP